MNVEKLVEGRNTLLGHSETHNWQPVQCFAMFLALNEPGGVIGVRRAGAILSSMTANPPSTFFPSCAKAAVATMVDARRKERFPLSGVGCSVVAVDL